MRQLRTCTRLVPRWFSREFELMMAARRGIYPYDTHPVNIPLTALADRLCLSGVFFRTAALEALGFPDGRFN